MKITYCILPFLLMSLFSNAQNSWKIKLNNKVVLASNVENDLVNSKKVKLSAIKPNTTLDILYKEYKPSPGWKRSFLFFDENDGELIRKDSVGPQTRISNDELRQLTDGKKKLKIYTVFLPTDPNMAAAIRVRRVHLCTLELQ